MLLPFGSGVLGADNKESTVFNFHQNQEAVRGEATIRQYRVLVRAREVFRLPCASLCTPGAPRRSARFAAEGRAAHRRGCGDSGCAPRGV